MRDHLKSSNFNMPVVFALLAVFATAGCGSPSATKPGESSSAAGMEQKCVGMGCDGEISAGLQEKCVGMGCPSDDKPQ